MCRAVFMAVYDCSTNCLLIDDGLLKSLFPNWILNDHHRLECEWLHFKGDESIGFQCIMVCLRVCTACVCLHICVPAVNNQISLFRCWTFSQYLVCFSLSIRICLKHLTGDFSCSGIGLFRFWSHSVSALILMNWLHKALRQHTLSSVINAQIHSFLFIWGGVWSFPTAEQMSFQTSVLSMMSDTCKLNPFTKIVNKNTTSDSDYPPSYCICIKIEGTSRLFHLSREHSSCRLFLICVVLLSHLILTLGLMLYDRCLKQILYDYIKPVKHFH